MVDGSLCRARHGRASETVHFPALRFVHATLSPRSRCGCVALRCGLLGAIAARLLLRLRAAGARLPASLFLAGWAVFRCGVLLLSPAARAWRGSFFKLPSCWLPLCWVRVSASGPLSAGWVVLFGGSVLGLLGFAALRRCGLLLLLVLHGPSPLAGFRAGVWVPPAPLRVGWGVLRCGDCSRFPRSLCLGGPTLCALAFPFCGFGLAWLQLAWLRGALFCSFSAFAVMDHFGVPACRFAAAGPRPARCRVCA